MLTNNTEMQSNGSMDNTFPIGIAAKRLGRAVQTLQRWDKSGALVALRTPTGRRMYTLEMLRVAFGLADGQAQPPNVLK